MLEIVLVFVLICCIYLWRYNVLFRRRIKDLPPVYPGVWPILGHCQLLISNGDETYLWPLMKKVSKIVTENGGIMTTFFGESPVFLMTDPTYCTIISNECCDKDIVYDFARPWLGHGLITASGEVWKQHRKLLNPAFSQQVLNSFIDIFNIHSKRLVIDLEVHLGKAPFNHIQYLKNTISETIYQTTIGINSENVDIKNKIMLYMKNVKALTSIVTTRIQTFWLHFEFIYKWSSLRKNQDFSIKTMNDIIIEVMNPMKATSKARESKTGTKHKVLLDLLLKYSADGSLSNKEVWDEVNTILLAAQEASTTTMVFILLLLGSHPVIQSKVYDELKEVFGNSLRDIDKIDLTKLVYLEAVIKESMRYYAIGSLLGRRVTKDIKLGNYTLPAGSRCVFLIHGVHHHPVWGADADQFRPERWFESSAPPRNAFAGFGLGKRYCIGKTYAMMFMKTVLAHVLRHYSITADVSKLRLKLGTILQPYSGSLISLHKRTV